MARIIIIILLTFVVSISFAQQYTPMTAAGYQMKRLKVDSTLHIPSFCGVPTTRNSTAKEGAVAMDTCNNLLYIWTNLNGWSSISGGTIVDTAAINAAIALRVKYTDTAGMLQPYLRKIDTTNKWVQSVTKLNDSTIRVVKNAITTDLLIRGNGVKYSDTAAMLSPYLRKVDTATLSNRINLKLNLSDTATMLSKYLRKVDTASLSSRINLKLNLSDTATMLSKYLRKTDTASLSSRINLKLNISDTSAMLSKYLRKTDTASLSARINTKLAIADTVNKWVQDVTKLNDSTIRVRKNNTNTDIILPKGTGGGGTFTSPNLQQVLDSGNVADKKILLVNPYDTSLANIEINPTNFNLSNESPFINLHIGNAGVYPLETFMKLSLGDDASTPKPYIYANDDGGSGQSFFKINSDTLSLRNTTNYSVTNLIMSGTSGNYHMPITNLAQINDTLATLQDVRANGGSGSGTVYVDSIYRTVGKDSIFYKKNGNTYAIKDSVGTGGSGGGGSAVSYYLNGGTAASVATYYQMSNTAVVGTNADFSLAGNGLISQWLTDVGNPNQLQIAAGNWNFEMYMSASSSGGTPAFYVQLLKYDGSTFTSIASSSVVPENIIGGTSTDLYLTSLAVPQTTLLATDRLAVRVYIVNSVGGRTITMHTQDSHLCQIITNFTSGISALNGLTSTTQTFATGTSGTDFGISSSGSIHTFNLPTASATNRGALSSTDWSIFNGKIGAADTSVFQRKSIAAYSFMANNTASTANATPLVYKDAGEQAYTGTITWTFTGSAPSGATTFYYRWSQIGKTVNYNFYFYYATASVASSAVTFDLPTDMPTPQQPTGSLGTGSFLYKSNNTMQLNQTGALNYTSGGLRKSATGYDWNLTSTVSTRLITVNGFYFVN